MLYLNVPYEQKDWAKRRGAKWDPERKQWYADERKKYINLSKWILAGESHVNVVCDHFYIVEGYRQCFKCGCMTKVITFGIDKFLELYEPDEDGRSFTWHNKNEGIYILEEIFNLSENFKQYLRENYKYYKSYSKFINDYYMANHCQNCGIIQGRNYLFDEPDSPFFVTSEEDAKNLTLISVSLDEDMIFDFYLLEGFSLDCLEPEKVIKKYANRGGFITYMK